LGRQFGKALDFVRQIGAFLQDGLTGVRVVPKSLFGNNRFDLGQPFLFAVDVKDSLVNGLIWAADLSNSSSVLRT
jgi:hypothetical protein